MNRFSQESEDRKPPSGSAAPPGEATSELSSIFHYPALGRLFDGSESAATLADMRDRLTRTHQTVERVIRQGGREDAERATRVSRAYTATLALLENLEKLQRQGGPEII